MKRRHVPQISYQPWFPRFLNVYIQEFVTWFVGKVNAAKPFIPLIEEGLQYSDRIVSIDADAGGGFETIQKFIDPSLPVRRLPIHQFEAVEKGLYISVNSFHLLRPNEAQELLRKISTKGYPVVVLEGNNDSLLQVFGMTVIVPLTVIFTAPLVRPFRILRLVFTYFVPILPLVTFLDGFLALFKLYAPCDLDELVAPLSNPNYQWRSGKSDNGRGGKIIYLIGTPKN